MNFYDCMKADNSIFQDTAFDLDIWTLNVWILWKNEVMKRIRTNHSFMHNNYSFQKSGQILLKI